jgi:hypothetical protein
MSNRRGISLVELILTLSACCVVLSLSAGLIHRAMHAQTKARRVADGERSAWRLGQAFRRDVRAANRATPGDGGDGDLVARLDLPGDIAVEYRLAAGRVERLKLANETVQSRETFLFPAEVTITVTQPAPRVVALAVESPLPTGSSKDTPMPAYAVPISLHIESVLDRHSPFVEAAAEKETMP